MVVGVAEVTVDWATMVEEGPWVMMTMRGRDASLGDAASLMAIWAMSLVCVRGHAVSGHITRAGVRTETETHVPLVAGGVRLGLGLVSDENVDEGEDLVDLRLEELGDEGGGEVHGEDLRDGPVSGAGVVRRSDAGPTLRLSTACWATILADSRPWVRKKPPR